MIETNIRINTRSQSVNFELHQLSLEFVSNANSEHKLCADDILSTLFTVFPTISFLRLRYKENTRQRLARRRCEKFITEIKTDWIKVLKVLFQQKTTHGITNRSGNMRPLKSLEVDMTVNHVINVMNGLHNCYAERYCNLRRVKISVLSMTQQVLMYHAREDEIDIYEWFTREILLEKFLNITKVMKNLKELNFILRISKKI